MGKKYTCGDSDCCYSEQKKPKHPLLWMLKNEPEWAMARIRKAELLENKIQQIEDLLFQISTGG